jgi:hypothetical protein
MRSPPECGNKIISINISHSLNFYKLRHTKLENIFYALSGLHCECSNVNDSIVTYNVTGVAVVWVIIIFCFGNGLCLKVAHSKNLMFILIRRLMFQVVNLGANDNFINPYLTKITAQKETASLKEL